jgi:nucleotide-binding universal stress UspA family protein
MFENVVVGATDSLGSARAMRRAVEVARVSGGTLHVVTAFRHKRRRRPPVSLGTGNLPSWSDSAEAYLDEFRMMAARESVRVEMHPVASDPVEAITRVAAEEDADLIVVGSNGGGGARHLSSVPKGVMDTAECAVLVV